MEESQPLSVKAGDTLPIEMPIKDDDGNAVDLTGLTGDMLAFNVYKYGVLKLQKTINQGIAILSPTAGTTRIVLTPADTAALNGEYRWEVVMTTLASEIYTVAYGALTAKAVAMSQPSGLAAQVALCSKYVVSDEPGSKFTSAQFDLLAARAKTVYLDNDLPDDVPADTYDHMHLLAILHLYEVARGGTVMQTEKLGDYQYAKPSGTSSFMQEYERELARLLDQDSFEDGPMRTRSDADMPELALDGSTIPNYSEDT